MGDVEAAASVCRDTFFSSRRGWKTLLEDGHSIAVQIVNHTLSQPYDLNVAASFSWKYLYFRLSY